MIVLDTSALVFWTLDRDRLSRTAAQAIADADRIILSSISIWEIGIKAKKEKLFIPISIQEFTDKLEQIDRLDILSSRCPDLDQKPIELELGSSRSC